MRISRIRIPLLLLTPILGILTACSLPVLGEPSPFPSPMVITLEPTTTAASPTVTVPLTPSPVPSATPTATIPPTATSTQTPPPTETPVPTETPTLTITPTPTQFVPLANILMQANCRYGPGTAYLYSHGLYAGDQALIDGKNYSGSWLWVKPENLDRHCWASASVLEINGDLTSVPVVQPKLPYTTFAGPPANVQAVRQGDRVMVSWNPVILSEDKRRGYLLEVSVCQSGSRLSLAVHTDHPQYEFQDELTCAGKSGGKLYTAEKHGYSDPVVIAWP